jgi:hypothetical protein
MKPDDGHQMAETCGLSSIEYLDAIKLYSVVFTTEHFHQLYIVSSTQRGYHTSKLLNLCNVPHVMGYIVVKMSTLSQVPGSEVQEVRKKDSD